MPPLLSRATPVGKKMLVFALMFAGALVMAAGGGALGTGDVCYRFCEDASLSPVSRRLECPASTTCETTMAPGTMSSDNCAWPDTCQPEASEKKGQGGQHGKADVDGNGAVTCDELVAFRTDLAPEEARSKYVRTDLALISH